MCCTGEGGWSAAGTRNSIARLKHAVSSADVSVNDALPAIEELCATKGRCLVRDSTPLEWGTYVNELRRREQDKAVGLLMEELEDGRDGAASYGACGQGGAAGPRVAKRIKVPLYGRPEVDCEWPRALLDAPCAGQDGGRHQGGVWPHKTHRARRDGGRV